MLHALKSKTERAFATIIALAPWLLAMYLFYWLDASGTWTSETPHRGKLSVAILATGMLLSFLIQSRISGREQK